MGERIMSSLGRGPLGGPQKVSAPHFANSMKQFVAISAPMDGYGIGYGGNKSRKGGSDSGGGKIVRGGSSQSGIHGNMSLSRSPNSLLTIGSRIVAMSSSKGNVPAGSTRETGLL